jgi:hypothetical protein
MYIEPTSVYKVENKNPNKNANPYYYLVVTDNKGEMLFTKTDISRGVGRAQSNREDIPNYKVAKTLDRNVCWCLIGAASIGGFALGMLMDFILNMA